MNFLKVILVKETVILLRYVVKTEGQEWLSAFTMAFFLCFHKKLHKKKIISSYYL